MNESKRRASRQLPWDSSDSAEPGAFGGWLRREREAREVSLAEIADVTKISKAHLEALEDGRFDVLPAPIFAKGFLREYAKYVGLDPDEVVNSYLTALHDNEPDGVEDEIARNHRNSFEWTSGILLAVGLVVLLAAIGFLGFWAERSQDEDSTPAAAPADVPAAEPVAVEPPVEAFVPPTPIPSASPEGALADRGSADTEPPAPLVVTIDFTEDCWVEASVDGRRRLSELHVQGESVQIDAQGRVELTLGNPGAVQVEVNGEAYPLEGYRPGRVARDIVILLEGEG